MAFGQPVGNDLCLEVRQLCDERCTMQQKRHLLNNGDPFVQAFKLAICDMMIKSLKTPIYRTHLYIFTFSLLSQALRPNHDGRK